MARIQAIEERQDRQELQKEEGQAQHDRRLKELDEKSKGIERKADICQKRVGDWITEQRDEVRDFYAEKHMVDDERQEKQLKDRQEEDRQREEDRQQGRKKEEEEDEQRRLQNQDEDRQREEEKKKLHQLQVEQLKDVGSEHLKQFGEAREAADRQLQARGEVEGRKFQEKVDNEKVEVGGIYAGLKQLVLDNAKTVKEFSDTVEKSTADRLNAIEELEKRLKPGNNDAAENLVRIMIIS